MKTIRICMLAASLSVGFSLASPAFAAKYTALDLGAGAIPSSINASGQVAGYFIPNPYFGYPVITGPNGVGVTRVSVSASYVGGINNSGQIAGWSVGEEGFFTGPNGVGVTYLDPLDPNGHATATDINDSGQVVGTTNVQWFTSHAFITGANGVGMTDLGTLGGYSSRAAAVNASGQVVGTSDTSNIGRHAFITGPNGVGMVDLHPQGIGGQSNATAINDAGQVAGSLGSHAFVTGPNGMEMKDLGTLYGGSNSVAHDINASGWVVGTSYTINGPGGSFAFIAGVDGAGMTDLNTYVDLGNSSITFTDAFAINDIGQIVAASYGQVYLLSPIPEPESYALMLAGLVVVGYVAHRRKRIG